MQAPEVKVRVTSDVAGLAESKASFGTGGTTSGLVTGLEQAKTAANDALSRLVEATRGQDEAREEDLEECDPAANDEPDVLEEQLHLKSSKKKSKPCTAHPVTRLHQLAAAMGLSVKSLDFALAMDKQDPLASFRDEFHLPQHKEGEPALYFCGNSLGLMPKMARVHVEEELKAWERSGVEGHFTGPRPWAHSDDFVREQLARIVGANKSEVVAMNGLTTNLHLMLVPFYRPTATRFRILMEKKSFPSDLYAVQSQVTMRGFDPASAIIELAPRDGEFTLRTEDIEAAIEQHGDSIALVMFSGIQYYTGQFFDIQRITAAGHKVGAVVGWDLAHAAGNCVLQLHEWNVDWAVWCSYKYLNSGPGGIAGAFVHTRHHGSKELQRLGGWWSQNWATRFDMNQPFDPIDDAYGFRLSNPPILQLATLLASVNIFDRATMPALRAKSELLTGYLELLINSAFDSSMLQIITPHEHTERGCQLSLYWHLDLTEATAQIEQRGVIVDVRKPNVTRLAPAPLYNSFADVWRVVQVLESVVGVLKSKSGK